MSMNPVLLAVFIIAAPLVSMVQLLLRHQLTLKLREEGLHARGKVIRVRTSWLNGKYRIVEYVFFLPDGSEIASEYKERRSLFQSQRASEGDLLEVLYLPDNPHRHQRVGEEMGLFTVLSVVFGLVVFMSLSLIVVMNAPAKQAPAPQRPPPSNRLRNYDEPSHSRPHTPKPQRQLGAY